MTAPKFTPGPLALAIYPAAEAAERIVENLKHGSGDVWGVWAPLHPLTKGEHPNPEHAVMTCITGNGPTSEANAVLYAAAPDLYAALVKCEAFLLASLAYEQTAAQLVEAGKATTAALRKARGES